MDFIYVFNGLGNQMSQYSLSLIKKSKGHKVTCIFKNTAHNGIELNRIFGINTNNSVHLPIYNFLFRILSSSRFPFVKNCFELFLSIFGMKSYVENRDYSFKPAALLNSNKKVLYIGGWHHYKYLEGYEHLINDTFKFPMFKDERNLRIANEIDNHSVAIHIRKGDYVDKYNYNIYGRVCDEDYYKNAINKMESVLDSPVYYVFSNDIDWARKIIAHRKAVYIDWNKGENSWADMSLMSMFKNIIIANSTFSWWAAWLGRSDKYVICPKVFVYNDLTSDIYKQEWNRV